MSQFRKKYGSNRDSVMTTGTRISTPAQVHIEALKEKSPTTDCHTLVDLQCLADFSVRG